MYKSIFISDVHLGSKDSKAAELNEFLKTVESENIYLVGDIIDAWKIQQNKFKWKNSHTDVVRTLLKKSRKGTQIIYVAGNHDEFLRPMIRYAANFGNVKICNQIVHEGLDGKKYLVVHGDLFDGITRLSPWISFMGDKAYDVILDLNSRFNWIRHRLGFGYWSLSKWLKHRVKKAINFIFEFELTITAYAKRKGYDGVICGHIHYAEIKTVNDITYMNDGDWVESKTALVEHMDGRWEILRL
jgi:UDP-2,3-diacylglucosamine pyrophosphatase LpxH